jgi:hypothetical protein
VETSDLQDDPGPDDSPESTETCEDVIDAVGVLINECFNHGSIMDEVAGKVKT